MLGRKAAARRHRQLRDRGTPHQAPPRPVHPSVTLRPAAPVDPIPSAPITFVWPDARRAHRHVVLVASFDGWLHHRMRPPTPAAALDTAGLSRDQAALAAAFFSLTLRVPPGHHTYKFLVDGVWSTDPSGVHPIHLSVDGVKHHHLEVPKSATTRRPTHSLVAHTDPDRDLEHRDRYRDRDRPAHVTMARLADADPRSTTVFRSASASAVPSFRGTPATAPAASSSISLHEQGRRKVEVAPRGSSFNAPPTVGSISATQTANRKSLLQRVGYGWMKRFSARADDQSPAEPAAAPLCSRTVNEPAYADRSASAIFRQGRERPSLFPSASDPNVGGHARDADKENSFMNKASPTAGTPERGVSRRAAAKMRGSARGSTVTVSRPTKVDEPRDTDEVNRQADNWRHMARHLQEDLYDPKGARELFAKAIQHREKHGLWCTSQNAQVHVDLARNLSKADKMKDAELHLRIALRIYMQIEAGHEHIADLLLYVGVVVDRQRRRIEAEELYRKALEMYKQHRLVGNNLEIAVKNLSLNLRKQNRDAEIDGIRREFCVVKGSSVIV